jgi:hypothetical protein
MVPEEYRVSDEVLAQLQETCMDRAVKRLEVNIIITLKKYLQSLILLNDATNYNNTSLTDGDLL